MRFLPPAVPLLAVLLCGCAPNPVTVQRALVKDRPPASHGGDPAGQYLIGCPDVLRVTVQGLDEWNGTDPVRPDGRIALTESESVRAEGRTAAEVARLVAEAAGVSAGRVRVEVVEHKSQHVYLFGEFPGGHRVIPYRGPETIADLLQRVGGIGPGAAPGDIQVVRARVADGLPPEVFAIDLEAIVVKNDPATNVRLQAFDQVYVGQSRGWSIRNSLPPWMRPAYEAVAGLRRPGGPAR